MNSSGKSSYTKHFNIPRQLVNRENYILQRCFGKRVIHIGCMDYGSSGNWHTVIESGEWLHSKIRDVAVELIGIDNASEAVQFVRTQYQMKDIYVADAEHLENFNKGTFDVIIAGEILEHLQSPGAFLNSAHSILKEDGTLIVTTTNAFCLRRFLRIPFGQENVHVDHVAYFSHRTLARLANACGYSVVDQFAYRIPNKKPLLPYLAERLACIISPNLCEGIVCCMKNRRQGENKQAK